MRVQFRNPFPLLIKFKTLSNNNNPNSSLESHRFFPHLLFFSSSSSSSGPVNRNSNNTDIVVVVTNPMATAKPKPPSLPSASSTAQIDNTVGIAAKCWSKYKPLYDLCLYTPFVIALAAGNLNRNSFRHYIAQDIFFLKAFVNSFNKAEDYADDDDAKTAIAVMRDSVRKESEMHDKFVEWCKLEWGIDIAEDNVANPATEEYIAFLEKIAAGRHDGSKTIGMFMTPYEKTKAAAYIMGSLTPCMRLYSYIGKELLAILGDNISSHLYRRWIDNYSSNAFQETSLQTEQLLDKLTATLTGEELDITEKLYYQALKLELEFFLAQPLAQKIVVPLSTELKETGIHLVLFSDFDLTCTKIDSSSILATVAVMTAPKTYDEQPEEQLGRLTSADMQETWDILSKQYTEEFEQYVENTLRIEKADKFDNNRLHQALKEVSEFEKYANTRVIRSGVLKGLNIEDIRKAGEHMQFEDGCTNFFSSILKAQNLSVDVHILSYCWCDDLIRSSLSSANLGAVKIRANQLVVENSSTTGEIVRDVESPHDKVRSFIKILQQTGRDEERLTVYIGDSLGDLLCLLKADIGIVIGRSESLRRVGEHFGVSFVPLYAALVKKQMDSSPWRGRPSGTLYTVSTWAEIHLFFFGNNPFKGDA